MNNTAARLEALEALVDCIVMTMPPAQSAALLTLHQAATEGRMAALLASKAPEQTVQALGDAYDRSLRRIRRRLQE